MKKFLALTGLTALMLTACTPASKGTIKIGFIGPLTGDAAALGADELSGVKWAVDQANAKGGVKGMTVELIAEDGKCTGSDAASAAQKLVNVDKVIAIVGGLCSGETLAAAPIAEAGKVVLISPGSSSPDVSSAGDFVFRDYPSDALKTQAMAKYFNESGFTRVAMISENTDFAQAFRTSLKKNLPEGTVIFDEVVEPGTKDYRSLLTRMKNVSFDVFFPDAQTDGVMAVMMQQYREAGFTQKAVAHDVADSITIAQIAGKAAEGFELINVPTAGEGTDFEVEFVKKFGSPKGSIAWAAHSYDATNVLFQAMESTSADGTAIRDYLYALPSYRGVVGQFKFDRNGDALGIPYVLKVFRDGKIVKVKDLPVN